jgi:hypothetical protein
MPVVSRARLLHWAKPDRGRFGLLSVPTVPLEELAASGAVAAMLHDMILPATRGTPIEEAAFLLQIASEVEHAFLLQYLYAAYSLDAGAGAEPAKALRSFVQLAKQEMGHFVTVQNLLRAIRQPLYLDREDFPLHPELYPFPAGLEPVTSLSVAKYVTAEAPSDDQISGPDKDAAARAKAEADQYVGPINRVGAIYAVIYWLFQSGDQAEGPWTLDPATITKLTKSYGAGFHIRDTDFAAPDLFSRFAATTDEWQADDSIFVDPTDPRASALIAIHKISAQGEGLNSDSAVKSHFEVLAAMYRDSLPRFPAGAVRDIPINPFVLPEGSTPTSDPTEISEPQTRAWAGLLSARYRILLLDIFTILSLDRASTPEAALRSTVVDWAVNSEMLDFISQIARLLVTKPRTTNPAAAGPKFAGAPFAFGDPLPTSMCGLWKEQRALVQRCASLAAQISPSTPQETSILREMQTFDSSRKAVIDDRIQNLCGSNH